jgi:hypothetical protein
MAVQTRVQLQDKSATVQNETVANANTALRVGGLFDDFADSVTLNGERGLTTLYLDSSVSYTPSTSTEQVVDVAMLEGQSFGSVFSSSEYAINYNGTISAPIRISVQLTFTGTSNRRYSFWIAQDGNIIPQSLSENTTQGAHNHVVCAEAFVVADTGSYFEIYAESNDSNSISIKTLTFAAFTI